MPRPSKNSGGKKEGTIEKGSKSVVRSRSEGVVWRRSRQYPDRIIVNGEKKAESGRVWHSVGQFLRGTGQFLNGRGRPGKIQENQRLSSRKHEE